MFDAVLVDEYQDVNAIQADIVRLLAPETGHLTCVGDDAQAIYGFRGADPEHLRRLAATFPGLTVVRLDRNYRSRQPVLELANAVRPQSGGLELALTSARGPAPARCWCAATTRPPRPGRSAPGSWTPTRTARPCATRPSWSARRTTATCWRWSWRPAASRS